MAPWGARHGRLTGRERTGRKKRRTAFPEARPNPQPSREAAPDSDRRPGTPFDAERFRLEGSADLITTRLDCGRPKWAACVPRPRAAF